jgi:hypothetical protein
VSRPQLRVGSFKDIPPRAGLRDGGHVVLSCSACGRPLVDVWVVKPDALDPTTGGPFVWHLRAECCYCGDRSFPVEVRGRWALGPAGEDVPNPDPEGMDDARLYTAVTRIETEGRLVVFHTKERKGA